MTAPRTLPGSIGWSDLERQRRRALVWDVAVSALGLACLFLPMFIDLWS